MVSFMIHGIIIHACVVIFDKNKVFLSLLHITNKVAFLSSEHFFDKTIGFFSYLCNQKHYCWWFFFSILCLFQTLTGNFISSKFFSYSNSSWIMSSGIQVSNKKHHLKHSLSVIFSILFKPFREWCNSFGNLI